MAIVNVTPDSFSDGGERLDPAQAIDDGLRFVSEGADIVDVGGEFDAARLAADRAGRGAAAASCRSSRAWPGTASSVSIDTRRASVARACLDAGARIVNDVSALRDDPDLMPLVAAARRAGRADAPPRPAGGQLRRSRPTTTSSRTFAASCCERAEACQAAGIARERIALDPGIGFGKSVEENSP